MWRQMEFRLFAGAHLGRARSRTRVHQAQGTCACSTQAPPSTTSVQLLTCMPHSDGRCSIQGGQPDFEEPLVLSHLRHGIDVEVCLCAHSLHGCHTTLARWRLFTSLYSLSLSVLQAAVQDISTQLLRDFNYATVWGTSTKHNPMRAGLKHILNDEDVLQVNVRTNQQQRRSKNYAAQCQVRAAYVSSMKFTPSYPIAWGRIGDVRHYSACRLPTTRITKRKRKRLSKRNVQFSLPLMRHTYATDTCRAFFFKFIPDHTTVHANDSAVGCR